MKAGELHKRNMTAGDVGLLLSSITCIMDTANQKHEGYGFSKANGLTVGQQIMVFHEVIEFFKGAPIPMGAPHAEALLLLEQDNSMWEEPGPECRLWDRRQLMHLCAKLHIPLQKGDCSKMSAHQFNAKLQKVVKHLCHGWTEHVTIREADARIASQVYEESSMLYFSRRKIRGVAMRNEVSGTRVAVLLHHELGRVVIEKVFPSEPSLTQLQSEIDAGPIGWRTTKQQNEVFSDSKVTVYADLR
jgi:hypothetical protein